MPDSFTVEVKGLAELEKALLELPEKMAKTALRTASRKSANLVKMKAQSNVKSLFQRRTGHLEGGILVSTRVQGEGVKGATILTRIGLRISGSASAWYGRLLEFGWMPRSRKARRSRGAGHKITGRPFMAPAFETTKLQMLDTFQVELRSAINRITFRSKMP